MNDGQRKMGKEIYLKDIEALFKKSPVVSASSISRLMRSKKGVTQYQKQLIRNLLLKGKIKKLVKGHYTIYDDPSLAVFCFKPAYLGLQDALSFHEVWEQETIPVIITASKARQGMRKVLGMNILVKRIDKRYLFGYEHVMQGNLYYPYSDLEKTFIDMGYFRQQLSEETLHAIKERVDKKKLHSYLRNYPKRFRERF